MAVAEKEKPKKEEIQQQKPLASPKGLLMEGSVFDEGE